MNWARAIATGSLALALLAACQGGPLPPQWRRDASAALDQYRHAWLRGESRIAEQAFERARSELASTGSAELVARAELTRCALQGASLDFDDCPGLAPLARDAGAGSRAYSAYIGGRWAELDPALLPAPHRMAFTAVGGANGEREGVAPATPGVLGAIEEPVARLVAAGALMRVGKIVPEDIALVVETASAHGWRRPLLAWLGVQEERAQAAGDAEAAAAIRRRIALVLGSPKQTQP
ncbi:hypothetical protein [Zeimonas arvi]|uniref:Uncharacterized protein n=1 Tax=Zeimonas arvi TaxID=2498847 RepID=A0A5C8P004_9BURK|nr:hypothetical protein [Zeimonas arvi]TXL66929.1 hypothetical protein FHP08_04695 [Zeimonas arvi]